MMSPSGFPHGALTATLAQLLANHVKPNKLGTVYGAETGFFIQRDPDTVRAPDVAFVRADRLKNLPKRGFFPAAPDLAVEVLSPDDSAGEVLHKVQQWLDAGTISVWIVDPERERFVVYRKDQPTRVLEKSDDVTDEQLLPGLRLKLSEVFS